MAIRKNVRELSPADLQKIINSVRTRVKQDATVRKMFDEYGISIDEIDSIPMRFADLDVSARTDHGIISFNFKLLEDGDFEKDDHYMVHEITHWLQQTTGDRPTSGSTDDTYLDNKEEQEGFQNQTEYLSRTRGEQTAEKYVDKVLDHHGVDGEKREEHKKELLDRKAALIQLIRQI